MVVPPTSPQASANDSSECATGLRLAGAAGAGVAWTRNSPRPGTFWNALPRRSPAPPFSSRAMSMSWSSWPPISLRRPPRAGSRRRTRRSARRLAGVLEERGVDPGVAHHQRHPVEPALLRHGRADDVLGGVDDLEEVDAGLPAELVADADERLQRRVAGAGAEAADGAVDLGRAGPHRQHGVGRRRGRGSRGRGSPTWRRRPSRPPARPPGRRRLSRISAPAESTT